MTRLALAVALLSGCTAGEVAETVRLDSAGTTIVTYGGPDRLLDWHLEEISRFGGADSGAGSFSRVTRHNLLADSERILILDSDRAAVEVRDPNGDLVTVLGRRGGGPGELADLGQLLDMGTDRIGVMDYGKMAVVSWNGDGELLPERPNSLFGVAATRGDTTWSHESTHTDTATITSVRMRIGSDSLLLAGLSQPPLAIVQFSCVGMRLAPVFSPRLVWDFHDGVVATARQDRYEVVLSDRGNTAMKLRRSVAAVSADRSMVEREHPDGMTVGFGGGASCKVGVDELLEKLGAAPVLPLIRTVALAGDGEVWVERYRFGDEPPLIDLFSPRGEYLGTLEGMPMPVGWLGDGRVLVAHEDEVTGVMEVVLSRLVRIGSEQARN